MSKSQIPSDLVCFVPFDEADKDLANACREWIKGCSCAPPDSPQECTACTNAFLNAVLTRAKNHGLEIGANAIWADGCYDV
jgi:hypothetical protein